MLSEYFPGNGQPKVFNSCGDFVLGGGKNVKGSVKPDIAITRGTVEEAELRKPAIFAKLHMLGECKTARGKAFHSQCAKYVERFGHPGAAYDFVIGVKAYRVTVMLFTSKAWSEVADFDYRDMSEEMVAWLHLLMRDDCPDTKLREAMQVGLKLIGTKDIVTMYHRGMADEILSRDSDRSLSPIQLAKPSFRNPGLFGSKTRVWSLRAAVRSGSEAGGKAEGALVVKHSFVWPGRVPNGHYFMEEVRRLAEEKEIINQGIDIICRIHASLIKNQVIVNLTMF